MHSGGFPTLNRMIRGPSVAEARYHTIVHAMNRHKGYGIPVSVIASSKQEAINKAVDLGWNGRPSDARVSVESVEEFIRPVPEPDDSGATL
jgi:hypothetical protein